MTRPTITSATLVDWFEPSTLALSDGDDVTSLTGENDKVLTGAVGQRPTFYAASNFSNSLPMMYFDGNSERLTITDADFHAGTVSGIFAVVPLEADATTGFKWLMNQQASTNASTVSVGYKFDEERWNFFARLNGSEATVRRASGAAFNSAANPIIVSYRYDGTTMELRINGVTVSTTAISGAIDTDTPGITSIGNHPTANTSASNMLIGEFGLFTGAISTAELEALEAYMMSRYNIADHTIGKWLDRRSGNPIISPDAGASEAGIFPAEIRQAGSTLYMFAAIALSAEAFTKLDYWTAPANDPHNWTRNVGGYIIDSANDSPTGVRGGSAVFDGTDWHILVDSGSGTWYYFSGSNLAALTDNGAVFSGADLTFTGGDHARHICILADQVNGSWVIYGDYRTGISTSGAGGIFRTTTTDFTTFTTPVVVLDPAGQWWERDDLSAPNVVRKNGVYHMLYGGFNDELQPIGDDPHWIGYAGSRDGINWTRHSPNVPMITPTADEDAESVDQPLWHNDGSGTLTVYYRGRETSTEGISIADLGDLNFLASTSTLRRGVGDPTRLREHRDPRLV